MPDPTPEMPKNWPERVAIYAVDISGLRVLDANARMTCKLAAEWAWQRVLEERERVSGSLVPCGSGHIFASGASSCHCGLCVIVRGFT